MSKYQPLAKRLAGHRGDEWRASFAEIEEVLGFPLPKAARNRAWWANTGDKPHSRAWMAGGWRADMDQAAGAVTFRRPVSEAALQGAIAPAPAGSPLEPVSEQIRPLAITVAAEEASIRSRLKGWGVTAAIAAGAAVVAGVGALVLRARMRRRSVSADR
jgi:hypothetical protein